MARRVLVVALLLSLLAGSAAPAFAQTGLSVGVHGDSPAVLLLLLPFALLHFLAFGFDELEEPVGLGYTPGQGLLRLDVVPRDAEVYLDGRYVGRAGRFAGPGRFLALAPGRHAVEVVHPGYEPLIVEFTAEMARVVTLAQSLAPLHAASPPAERPVRPEWR